MTASIFQIFRNTDLRGVDLSDANLEGASLTEVVMSTASLRQACLRNAVLMQIDLSWADLGGADLEGARVLISNLAGAKLHGARLGRTHIGGSRLSGCPGLAEVRHLAPSHVDAGTMSLSAPMAAEFLNGAGVHPGLRRLAALLASGPRYRTCFISYTSADLAFAAKLHAALLAQGVPVWFAPVDSQVEPDPAKDADDRNLLFHLKAFVDTAECTLLVLSAAARCSRWVMKEVERAAAMSGRSAALLFALAIDESSGDRSFAYTTPATRTVKGKVQYCQQWQECRFDGESWFDFRTGQDPRAFEQALSTLTQVLLRPKA